MASAPPLAKRKDPPTTPLSEPTPKNPKTSASIRQRIGISTSTPQAKSPYSSKKQPSSAATQGPIYRHKGDIVMGGLITVIAKHFGFDPEERPLPELSDTLYFDATHLSKTGFSLPPSDTAQPEAQPAPAVQQHSAEPVPPTQKLESSLDTLKDRHDQLFDLVMETKDKQKELKEMMKQLMAFLGMPPPPPSPPPKPPLQQQPAPSSPLVAPLDKGKTIELD
ncbi:uncharacterized protein LOC131178428 [Hevea brasiliensis]|uniref:uncharacterized protein LOC131178428 n=1 Tax=Hevea brasiliensis TaxID=3981 RepID=UPI0025E462A7|nr:uncharacterized protein LOC131178428 [Hevea brasiliensis]